jgi:hypothetical protein
VTIQAKMLHQQLLNVKADLDRELGLLVLDCKSCGRTVHLGRPPRGVNPGRSAHREPAPPPTRSDPG